jgi:hypothetical protein
MDFANFQYPFKIHAALSTPVDGRWLKDNIKMDL